MRVSLLLGSYHCTTSVHVKLLPAKILEPKLEMTATVLREECPAVPRFAAVETHPSRGLSSVIVPFVLLTPTTSRDCPRPTVRLDLSQSESSRKTVEHQQIIAPGPSRTTKVVPILGVVAQTSHFRCTVAPSIETTVAEPNAPEPSVVRVSRWTQFCSDPASNGGRERAFRATDQKRELG